MRGNTYLYPFQVSGKSKKHCSCWSFVSLLSTMVTFLIACSYLPARLSRLECISYIFIMYFHFTLFPFLYGSGLSKTLNTIFFFFFFLLFLRTSFSCYFCISHSFFSHFYLHVLHADQSFFGPLFFSRI